MKNGVKIQSGKECLNFDRRGTGINRNGKKKSCFSISKRMNKCEKDSKKDEAKREQ